MVRIRQIRARSHGGDIMTGVDAREHVDGGESRHGRAGVGQRCPRELGPDQSQERRSGKTDRGDSHAALKGSEDQEGRDSSSHRKM